MLAQKLTLNLEAGSQFRSFEIITARNEVVAKVIFWESISLIWNYYRPQRSCGQGNIFTPVYHSIHGEVSASVHAGMPPPGRAYPPWSRHPPEQTPPRADPPGPDPPKADTPLG